MAKDKQLILLKKISSWALAILISISISGCRTKGQKEEETKEERAQKKEIVWWHLFDPCDTFRGQIQAFESANKEYKITCKKFSNAEEYENLITNELAEGEGPDIFSIKNTKVIQNYKKITPMPPQTMVPEQFKAAFFSVAADDLIFEPEKGLEEIYAIPLYIDTLALYYNKTLFRDNLQATDTPGITWEEIKEQVYGLTKKDNSIERFSVAGIAMGRSDNISRAIDIMQLLLLQYGTSITDEKEKRAIFANQQGTEEGTGKAYYPGRKALEDYTAFALSNFKIETWNLLITSFTGDTKEVGVFVKGKVAMIFGYSWLYDEIISQIQKASKPGEAHISESEIGVAPAPQLIDPEKSGKRDALASYYALTVSRNSQYPDAAWEFINFLAQVESLQDYHSKTHKPTPRKDMVNDQSAEKIFGVFAQQASYAKSLKTFDDNAFIEIFNEAISSVSKSKKTVTEALEIAQKKMTCVLDKFSEPTLDKDCLKEGDSQ